MSIAYRAAYSGIVVWKAVSKTATCGRSGRRARAVRMPVMFAGLCSGATGTRRSISFSTSSSITTGSVNRSPPCTTRWPIAASCGESRPSPSAASSCAAAFSAASWSAIGPIRSRCSAPPPVSGVCTRREVSSPIRSTSPTASRVRSLMSSSWYFTDEEPELRTSTRYAPGVLEPAVVGVVIRFTPCPVPGSP